MLLREGLTGLLHRCGHEVVAAVGDAQALVAAVEEHGPDIVVTDVTWPVQARRAHGREHPPLLRRAPATPRRGVPVPGGRARAPSSRRACSGVKKSSCDATVWTFYQAVDELG